MDEFNLLMCSYVVARDWNQASIDFFQTPGFQKDGTVFKEADYFKDRLQPTTAELKKLLDAIEKSFLPRDIPFVLLIQAYMQLIVNGLRPGKESLKTRPVPESPRVSQFTDLIQSEMDAIKRLSSKVETASDFVNESSDLSPMDITLTIEAEDDSYSFNIVLEPKKGHPQLQMTAILRNFIKLYRAGLEANIRQRTEKMIKDTIEIIGQ